jgi:hypothetical protein
MPGNLFIVEIVKQITRDNDRHCSVDFLDLHDIAVTVGVSEHAPHCSVSGLFLLLSERRAKPRHAVSCPRTYPMSDSRVLTTSDSDTQTRITKNENTNDGHTETRHTVRQC